MACFHFAPQNDDVAMGFSVSDHSQLVTLNGFDCTDVFCVSVLNWGVMNKNRDDNKVTKNKKKKN